MGRAYSALKKKALTGLDGLKSYNWRKRKVGPNVSRYSCSLNDLYGN
jgi:hypothetical protein